MPTGQGYHDLNKQGKVKKQGH